MHVTLLARRGVPTARAPGGRPFRPLAVLQTTTDDNRRQRAKRYWPIRRVSNNRINYITVRLVGLHIFESTCVCQIGKYYRNLLTFVETTVI